MRGGLGDRVGDDLLCCSIAHAAFVQQWLAQRGVRVRAVHSGTGTAERDDTLAVLARGDLDAVCSVDLFNERIYVPAVDKSHPPESSRRPTGGPCDRTIRR